MCRWCQLGWKRHKLPYKGKPEYKHSYPADYKGQRTGLGPYCEDQVEDQVEDPQR